MKLVFALVLLINNAPSNTDGMYFDTAEACNTVAFQTEKGYAGEGKSWTTSGINIRAYCEPKIVDDRAETFDQK
jgi:hypothetical protein